MSPPSFGHLTPVGIERVPRHFGNLLQPRNSPERPWRITIGSPHSWQISSVGWAGLRSPRSGRVYLHSFGWFSHARNGPKKPPRGTSFPPHVGHFSVASADKSCASPISASMSAPFTDSANGP